MLFLHLGITVGGQINGKKDNRYIFREVDFEIDACGIDGLYAVEGKSLELRRKFRLVDIDL